MPVADTEFLFGMRSSDTKHGYVRSILDELERANPDKKKELSIPPMAIFEFAIVCMSEGKGINTIIETLELIDDITTRYKLGIIEFNPDQLVKGLAVYRDLKRGFFDSLTAGSALAHDGIIIGDDEAFLSIPNLRRKTLKQYLEELETQ
nr:PIN domain-containing protein [Candidatus Njordarchaeum guaymaensis]